MYRHVKAFSLRFSVGSGNKGPASKRREASSRSQDEEVVFTVSRAMKMFTIVIFVMLGFRAGAVVKVGLPFHQSNPGLMPAQCHMWVEFVVGSCFLRELFSRFSGFPTSKKRVSTNSNMTRMEDSHENQLMLMCFALLIL